MGRGLFKQSDQGLPLEETGAEPECHIEGRPYKYLQNGKHAGGLETMQETGRPEKRDLRLLEHLKNFHGKNNTIHTGMSNRQFKPNIY